MPRRKDKEKQREKKKGSSSSSSSNVSSKSSGANSPKSEKNSSAEVFDTTDYSKEWVVFKSVFPSEKEDVVSSTFQVATSLYKQIRVKVPYPRYTVSEDENNFLYYFFVHLNDKELQRDALGWYTSYLTFRDLGYLQNLFNHAKTKGKKFSFSLQNISNEDWSISIKIEDIKVRVESGDTSTIEETETSSLKVSDKGELETEEDVKAKEKELARLEEEETDRKNKEIEDEVRRDVEAANKLEQDYILREKEKIERDRLKKEEYELRLKEILEALDREEKEKKEEVKEENREKEEFENREREEGKDKKESEKPTSFSMSTSTAPAKLPNNSSAVAYPVGLQSYSLDKLQALFCVDSKFITSLKDLTAFWNSFGKKNSHLIRKMLFDLMEKKGLTMEEKYMVYHICAFMKKKDRIMVSLERADATIKAMSWFKNVHSFFHYHTVTFPEDETTEQIATIHIPASNPPLSLFAFAIVQPKASRNVNDLIARQEMAQMWIDSSLLLKVKAAQKKFWNEVVTKTTHKNNQANFNARKSKMVTNVINGVTTTAKADMFDEDIFATQAADTYVFIGEDFKEISPADKINGFTEAEVTTWYTSLS